MRRVALVLALVGGQGGVAVGQDARLRARLPTDLAQQVERLVDSARAAGLPVEPLVQKALEGQTKGAAPERIVAAVRALGRALGESRQGLGAGSSAEELQAGILWLRAGGTVPMLAGLRDAAPDRSLAVPLVVAAEFLSRGWPVGEAAETLGRLVGARVSDADFLSLRRNIDAVTRQGGAMVPALRSETSRLVRAPPP